MTHFDYLPTHNSLMPPSFGQAGEFDAGIQTPEFFQNMFNMGGQPMGRGSVPSLQPLNMMQDPSMLLPSHSQIVSPTSSIASSSSGPSSPTSGPFTPMFNQLCGSDFTHQLHDVNDCGADLPQTQADLELQTELQLQQDLYSSYSWENNSIWPANSGNEMLLGEDFDLNAIPPIELGLPKFGEDMTVVDAPVPQGSVDYMQDFTHGMDVAQQQQQQYHNDGQNVDGMFGFDEMMSRHGY
jgi:hypothetical protein